AQGVSNHPVELPIGDLGRMGLELELPQPGPLERLRCINTLDAKLGSDRRNRVWRVNAPHKIGRYLTLRFAIELARSAPSAHGPPLNLFTSSRLDRPQSEHIDYPSSVSDTTACCFGRDGADVPVASSRSDVGRPALHCRDTPTWN